MTEEKYEFLPEDVKKAVPALYTNEDKKPVEVKVPLKFFTPAGSAAWYVTEADWETGLLFGFACLGFGPGYDELGYSDLNELKSTRLSDGLSVERDIHWNPNTTLEDVMEGRVR